MNHVARFIFIVAFGVIFMEFVLPTTIDTMIQGASAQVSHAR